MGDLHITSTNLQIKHSILLSMHRVSQNTCSIAPLKSSKTALCIWKSFQPQEPYLIMLSDSIIEHDCCCVLKDDIIVCGTNEGFIQLWDLRKSSSSSSSNFVHLTQQYSIHDNETMDDHRCKILSMAKVSNTMIALLDSRRVVEIWYVQAMPFKFIDLMKTESIL